jgi:hypothetical protein
MPKAVSQEVFVRDLLALLQRASSTTSTPIPGSVWITQKVILPKQVVSTGDTSSIQPYTLFRAIGKRADGKDIRLSCSVPRTQGAAFQALLSQTLRSGCSALRKVSKKEKKKAKEAVTKEAVTKETIVVKGK